MRWFASVCVVLGLSGASAVSLYGQGPSAYTAEQKQLNIASFEKIWTTVRDNHWEKKPGGLDWQAIHEEYRPKMERAESMDAARQVMRDMLARLKQTHFGIIPGSVYEEADADGGQEGGDGSPGIDVRVLDG